MEQNRKPDKRERISDALMIAGGLLLSVGAGMIEPAGGLIVAGIVSMTYGAMIGQGGNK